MFCNLFFSVFVCDFVFVTMCTMNLTWDIDYIRTNVCMG